MKPRCGVRLVKNVKGGRLKQLLKRARVFEGAVDDWEGYRPSSLLYREG